MNKRQRKKQLTVLRERALRACLLRALAEPNPSRREALKADVRALQRARRWPPEIRLEDFPPEASAVFAAAFRFARPGVAIYLVEQSPADVERLYVGAHAPRRGPAATHPGRGNRRAKTALLLLPSGTG